MLSLTAATLHEARNAAASGARAARFKRKGAPWQGKRCACALAASPAACRTGGPLHFCRRIKHAGMAAGPVMELKQYRQQLVVLRKLLTLAGGL